MRSTPPIHCSVAIIARDEARYIGECLTSLADLPDEVLVLLDTRTHDETAEIARQLGALVVEEPWHGFPGQRNRALDLCRGNWVLFLDADERLNPALRAEIRTIIEQPPSVSDPVGYWIPRYNVFFGRALRGGGWYPDPQLRLLRRDAARYDESRLVHESATLQGEAGQLREHMLHLNIERLDEFWHKQARYALAEARTLQQSGRRTRWRNFVGGPAREFWRRYVQLGGWRDGGLGLFLCATLAWFELVKFAFLRSLQQR
jgi:glycosyltransferase involved in cell wall biosynthesis